MPKHISDKVWGEIKEAYLHQGCKIDDLSALYKVSVRSIKQKAKDENWSSKRKARALTAIGVPPDRAAAAADEEGKLFDIMAKAIATLSSEIQATPAKSKEGCVNALVNIAKAQRELFPPSAEELAKIAADLGIRPADFIRALQKEWTDRDAQAS